jgi:glucose-6-phosphate dehydrogenase assembly protein OpcA
MEAAMNVKVDEIEPTLAREWHARGAVMASTVNLVALCTEPSRFDAAKSAIEAVLPTHPGRAIVAVIRDGEKPHIDAEVGLACDSERNREACGELIALHVHGGAVDWLPTVLDRLLRPGSRTNLWWVGDLPDDYSLYDKLTDIADRVTVNSEEVDLRDLRTLAARVVASRGRYALGDTNWVRLRMWQELLARFFDNPVVLPQLAQSRTLTVVATDHRRGPIEEPASPQAILFAAWFAQRIGARSKNARWTKPTGRVREIEIPRVGDGTLTVKLVTENRADVFPGAIVRIELDTDEGSHFRVGRDPENHRVLGWEGTCSGAVIPQAVMRIDMLDNAHMLARELDRPVRDPLFEASLAAAANLVAAFPLNGK